MIIPGITTAYLLDLLVGDPEGCIHPIRGIGKLISLLDKCLNIRNGNITKNTFSRTKERFRGIVLVLAVVGISTYLSYLFIAIFRKVNPVLGWTAWVYLAYSTLAIKDLRVKAAAILKKIESGSLIQARKQLSMIVGRDTENLDMNQVITATIESIAESINDGIIAPLFYLFIGGPVIAIAYKSINTLDSMVGYKNEKYLHFGWFSARLDDTANFIPARISGMLISIAALISGKNSREAFSTMIKEGTQHPSPNSGITEAAMAGALGMRLGGSSTYNGKISKKPYLGKAKQEVKPYFINEALTISFIVSFLMLFSGILLKWLL